MNEKELELVREMMIDKKVIEVNNLVGSSADTLELIFGNGRKLHITAFSEDIDGKGILETLEIQK